jgi:2-oxoglutarate dehydrogenase E1 component
MGYWNFLLSRLYKDLPMRVIARKASASPATGYHKVHVEEQRTIVTQALKTV